MSRVPPHDEAAELALLGACLVFRNAAGEAAEVVMPEDFYAPKAQALFAALVEVHAEGGDPTNVVEVVDRIRDPDRAWMAGLTSKATGSFRRNAQIVARHAALRRLLATAAETMNEAYDPHSDPAAVVDTLRSRLDAVDVPLGRPSPDLHVLHDFVQKDRPPAEWVIPHLLGRQHRVLVVAPEGAVKSSLIRQIVLMSSQGLHPFTLRPMQPIRVLWADFENPEDAVVVYSRPYFDVLRRKVGDRYDPTRAYIWHRPNGVDLRTRAGRSQLEANVAAVRPDLLCIGPLYKCYTPSARDDPEVPAMEVQRLFDDLRTRYGLAVLIEHHAPHGAGVKREMRPLGSSAWLRWPEFGLGVSPLKESSSVPKGSMGISRFRGDRLSAAWPSRLDRTTDGVPWRWQALWSEGMPDDAGEAF